MRIRKVIVKVLPYLLLFLLFSKVGQAIRLTSGVDFSEKVLWLPAGFTAAFSSCMPSFHPNDLLLGLIGAAAVWLAVYVKGRNARKYRKGEEYGSARWGTEKDILPFINRTFSENIILTQTERLTLGQIADPERRNINLNVLVIGGSGSGKTRYHVKPNLMQMNASYLVPDPKGTLIVECGKMIAQHGYKIRVLNTIRFRESMHYNPFAYVHTEADVMRLVTVLMENTRKDGTTNGDQF